MVYCFSFGHHHQHHQRATEEREGERKERRTKGVGYSEGLVQLVRMKQ